MTFTTEEGTFRSTAVGGDFDGVEIDAGKFWFEAAQLKFESICLTSQGEVIDCIGTCQVYVTKQGDKPVQLRFTVVDDLYSDRKQSLNRKKLPLVEP